MTLDKGWDTYRSLPICPAAQTQTQTADTVSNTPCMSTHELNQIIVPTYSHFQNYAVSSQGCGSNHYWFSFVTKVIQQSSVIFLVSQEGTYSRRSSQWPGLCRQCRRGWCRWSDRWDRRLQKHQVHRRTGHSCRHPYRQCTYCTGRQRWNPLPGWSGHRRKMCMSWSCRQSMQQHCRYL